MSNSMKIEIAIAACLITLLAGTWYFFWIKPHDEMVFWIMDCMGSESGRELYEECHKKFLIHKGISVG